MICGHSHRIHPLGGGQFVCFACWCSLIVGRRAARRSALTAPRRTDGAVMASIQVAERRYAALDAEFPAGQRVICRWSRATFPAIVIGSVYGGTPGYLAVRNERTGKTRRVMWESCEKEPT